MSIIQDKVDEAGRYVAGSAKLLSADPKKHTVSSYVPNPDDQVCINSVLTDFRLGWQTMHLARVEHNDMSLYQAHVDGMLSFNTYQANNGNPMLEDRLGGWKSQAMRPIQRNKAISVAAHLTARATVPKIFSFDEDDGEQEDSAQAMSYLVDWAREDSGYNHTSVHRVIMSLYSPLSWGYSEYVKTYRKVKKEKTAEGWTYDSILDEEQSGFTHKPVSADQVFFANYYEPDVQKQDFIIWRRVISYNQAEAQYGHIDNFKHVSPGVVVVMDDANQAYYNVYDPHMRGTDVEVVTRWKKWGSKDCDVDTRITLVNGVLMTDCDAQNPRQDHQYPWDAFYYLPINERCIAGKSLVAAMGPEAALLNAQYQMMNDGAYLNLYPPTITTGSDKIGLDVIVPGLNLAFADKDVKIEALRTADSQSLQTMLKVTEQVEASLNQSSQDPVQQGQNPGTPSTAYEISRIEQNAATVLGLSMKFIAKHAIDYGELLVSDILQYLTIADAESIVKDKGLLYKTFFVKEPGKPGKMNKIKFDLNLPDSISDDDKLAMSYDLLKEQGGIKSSMMLMKINPTKFRNFKYVFSIDSDVLNPRSAELERALDLETYNLAIASPVADQEKIFTDLLMSTNPKTARDPDRYVMAQQPAQPAVDPALGQPAGLLPPPAIPVR